MSVDLGVETRDHARRGKNHIKETEIVVYKI